MDDIAIRLENVSKYYKLYDSPNDRLKEALNPFGKIYHQDFYALKNINLEIKRGEVLGIVGKNGSGKSTILKLMAWLVERDGGDLQVAKGTTFGYLTKDGLVHRGRSLFAETQSALDDLQHMESELRQLENKIADTAETFELERYAELQQLFEQRGGYQMESEIGRVLHGLGFGAEDFDKPCETQN